MKQIFSTGAEGTYIGCQFFKQQCDTHSLIQDVVQYLRRVYVSGIVTPEVPLCMCLCVYACVFHVCFSVSLSRKHAVGG